MADLTVPSLVPRTEAEYEAAVAEMIAEMQRINMRIRQEQTEIERLQRESQQLKAETNAIKTRTEERLNALATMVLN
jgi:predicted  nucleic acid-binding Zn-ribbon protein